MSLSFSSYPLFTQGVESLLRRETGLEIVDRETDADEAIERIKELQPDVVIVDSGAPACDPTMAVMRVLREGVGTKVIGLNLQDNTMCIYRGEQRVVEEVKDLVEAIEPSPLSPEPVSSEDLAKVAGTFQFWGKCHCEQSEAISPLASGDCFVEKSASRNDRLGSPRSRPRSDIHLEERTHLMWIRNSIEYRECFLGGICGIT